MSTCCPNCSATALGTDAVSVCADCVTATVAGASFSLPLLVAGAIAAGVAVIAVRLLLRRSGACLKARQPALA
jgi:hypothetical protein